MKITGKIVLVTGANRGIGQALVEEALRRGAKRVYAGTRQPLFHSDPRVTPLTLDVTNAAQIQKALETLESLDILINNAGVAIYDDLKQSRRDRTAPGGEPSWPAESDASGLAAAETFQRGGRQQPVIGGARSLAGHTVVLHFEGSHVQHDAVTKSAPGRPGRHGPCGRPGPDRYRYEPRLRDTQGLARVGGAGYLRWFGKRQRGYLS